MTLCLSAPSKTLLAGEYAVLVGSPALVLCTAPRFELQVTSGTGLRAGIPTGSPASRWLELREPLLRNYDLKFVDPHGGRGGFGASGAQFLLVHAFTTFLQGGFSRLVNGVDLRDLWNDHSVLSEGHGSGADILALSVGGTARVSVETKTAQAERWPYPELSFAIVRTHEKTVTFEHLARLDRSRLKVLATPAAAAADAFGTMPPEFFIEKLKLFTNQLRESGLQSETALKMSRVLGQQDWCLAAKGCGAMGADTVLFLYPSAEESSVKGFLEKQGWANEAGVSDLSSGLRLEWRADAKS